MNSNNDNDNDSNSNKRIFTNHSILSKSWAMVIPRIIVFILIFILFFLWIPATLIWFITLGHINFFNLLGSTFMKLNYYVFGETN